MKTKTYISMVIDLLRVDDFYNVGDTIDIAKGRNELPSTWSGIRNTIKRNK